jgi:hypothetical protein
MIQKAALFCHRFCFSMLYKKEGSLITAVYRNWRTGIKSPGVTANYKVREATITGMRFDCVKALLPSPVASHPFVSKAEDKATCLHF